MTQIPSTTASTRWENKSEVVTFDYPDFKGCYQLATDPLAFKRWFIPSWVKRCRMQSCCNILCIVTERDVVRKPERVIPLIDGSLLKAGSYCIVDFICAKHVAKPHWPSLRKMVYEWKLLVTLEMMGIDNVDK